MRKNEKPLKNRWGFLSRSDNLYTPADRDKGVKVCSRRALETTELLSVQLDRVCLTSAVDGKEKNLYKLARTFITANDLWPRPAFAPAGMGLGINAALSSQLPRYLPGLGPGIYQSLG